MIEIRDATVQEIPELARAHVKADWDTYAPLFGAEAYMLDVTDSEGRWRQALRSGNVLLLAIRNSAIVGFGHCYEDRIGALYLLTPYHRQGIGGAILQKLLRALYGRGSYAPKAYQQQVGARVHELARRFGIGRQHPANARRIPRAERAAPPFEPDQLSML